MNKNSFEKNELHSNGTFPQKQDNELEEERKQIAEVTAEMMTLFEERQKLSRVIAEIKRREDLPTEDAEREKELLAKYACGDAQKERLLNLLFALSKEEQEKSRK